MSQGTRSFSFYSLTAFQELRQPNDSVVHMQTIQLFQDVDSALVSTRKYTRIYINTLQANIYQFRYHLLLYIRMYSSKKLPFKAQKFLKTHYFLTNIATMSVSMNFDRQNV